jgi:hypothetical protein
MSAPDGLRAFAAAVLDRQYDVEQDDITDIAVLTL